MVTGEYYNIFGITQLDADYSEIQNKMQEKSAAYLHERVHYMQNFGTVYGVNKALFFMSKYLGMILQIQQGKFAMAPYDREDQDFINSIFLSAEGDGFDSKGNIIQCHAIEGIEEIDSYSFLEYDKTFPEYRNLYEKELILKYDEGKEYCFGGTAISESMAYLFEQFFFDRNDYSHRFPYNACEMVYQYIMKKECKNIPVLIGLCYAALMTMCPGNTFVELLRMIKRDNIEMNSAKDVFEFAEDKMKGVDRKIIEEVFKKLDLIFPEEVEAPLAIYEEESKYTKEWLQMKYKSITENELAYRKALVWILDEVKSDKKVLAMFSLLKEYGDPVVIDIKGKMYSGEDKKLVHALAPLALFKVIIDRRPDCFLYNVCKANNGNPDEDCKKWCWKHKSNSQCCILRYYLYKMGLGAIQFEQLENAPSNFL